MEKKALVLLSGGQDSTTCLFWAKNNFESVEAIGFNYGQRHKLELNLANKNASDANIPFFIANISMLTEISKNALVSEEINVEESVSLDSAPNTLVEGRNMLFLTYAAIYAKSKNISSLVMGVGQTDYSNYPDCREEFIRSVENALTLATNFKFLIHTPLMWKSKAETWQMADELGVLETIKKNTLTCYNGIVADGCGNCPACKLRKKGWEEFLASKSNLKI